MTVQLEIDGTTRSYTLHIPRRTSRLFPLVLDLHGFGGTPEGQERNSSFSVKGGSEGFVVAQPAATGSIPRWNISSGSGSQRDVAFLRAVVEDIARELPIDRQAVFAAGFSNGGGMVHRLACEASDLVAAIGVVAGQQVVVDACTPADPVAVAALHGTSDDIVPFTGDGLLFPPITQWIQGWAERNSCSEPPQSSQPVPDVDRTVWEGCTDGATVELHTIDGGEHRWPTMPGDPISATDTLWDFFSTHARD
jgi:polyhydroxybutyrate depolymerase